ncbi:MAG: hypothetical protein OEU32_14730 [Acidimicrobiia bacterium]|nr:hypothetical protein [Acidimicrobiia bacterium]
MAVLLLVGRYEHMGKAADELLSGVGHRCIISLDLDDTMRRVAENAHDLVLIGPGLPPPQRDDVSEASIRSRPEVPVLHVLSRDDVTTLTDDIETALATRRNRT